VSDDAVAAVVASRRLGAGVGARRSFTVERTEARLRLRERAGAGPWEFALVLARGVLALADFAECDATTTTTDDAHTLELRITMDPERLAGFELGTVFDEALQPDIAGPDDPATRRLRARRLIARAINESLAGRPRQVDIETPDAARSFVRRVVADGDPFVERVSTATTRPGVLVFRIALDRTLGRWLGGLRFGDDGLFAPVLELWRARVPGLEPRSRGAGLGVHADPRVVDLGTHARLWGCVPARARGLVRDGVIVCSLEPALREAGVDLARVDALVECDALQLTVDEGNVVRDRALTTLVAWLHDAGAHTEGSLLQTRWPTAITGVRTAANETVALDRLAAGGVDPMPYVWRHEADTLPLAARPRVLALWPSEIDRLAVSLPELRLVHLRHAEQTNAVAAADVAALAKTSHPPLAIAVPPVLRDGAPPLPVDVVAYVHRQAKAGAVWLLAADRALARTEDADRVIAGVTLVVRVTLGAEHAALASDVAALRDAVRHIVGHVRQRRADLVAHVLAHSGGSIADARAPLVAEAIAQLDAQALGLRYEQRGDRPRLHWRDDPCLGVVVAHTRDGASRDLRAALERAADVGGLVVGDATRRWYVLEVQDARHDTWVPTPQGAELLVRVFGREALWTMPTVVQAHPHVAAAADQRTLLLDREEIAKLRVRSTGDGNARTALASHLLVASATGADALGLADVPLLHVYDPRAVTPDKIVSLDALRADERTFAIVPPGTARRELAGPVVVAPPGLAALLHEVLRLPLVAVPDGSPRTTTPAAARVASPIAEPVLRWPIADRLAAGALHLGGKAGGVELWARGLHVGDLVLASPLGELGGRLWLTDAGIRAGRPAIEAMLRGQARPLVETARRQAALAPPGSARGRALDRFVAHALATTDDHLGLHRLVRPSAVPRIVSADAASAARLPMLRRLWLGAIVRHALGRATTVDRAWLSWRLAKLADATAPAWTIEVGGRHAWIRRATADDAHVVDVHLAAIATCAEVAAQAGLDSVAIAVAMLRIVATAHVAPRT
jgi:hypothetical protein